MNVNNSGSRSGVQRPNDVGSSSKGKLLFAGAAIAAATVVTGAMIARGATPVGTRSLVNSVKRVTPPSRKAIEIKSENAKQFQVNKELADAGKWHEIRQRHFDWVAFPVKRPSRKHGNKFALSEADVEHLKQDEEFMDRYREGVDLVAKSWGWDVKKKTLVIDQCVSQRWEGERWAGQGVRLGKMIDSLLVFEEEELLASLSTFAKKRMVRESLDPWVDEILQRVDSR